MCDIAIQTASTEIEVEYNVDFLTLMGNYTQVAFELEPRKNILLPSSTSLTATQKGKQLNKKTIKSICKVYKNKELTEGILINHKTALNGDVSFVLVHKDGKIIKINRPDKIIFTDESVEILPYMDRGSVKINMVLDEAILFEFKHHLTKENDHHLLETILILNNESKYKFRGNNTTKILIPNENDEKLEVMNTSLTFKNIGDLNSFSKESIVIFSMKLTDPERFCLLSLLNPHSVQECLEFVLPDLLCPGEMTLIDEKESTNIFQVNYSNKGDKLQVNLGSNNTINIISVDNSDDFSLVVELETELKVKIKEFRQIKYIALNNKIMVDDTIIMEKGRNIISGKY